MKNMKYEHFPSEFYYPDETSVEASRPTESQEEIEGFLKEQKSANTSKKKKKKKKKKKPRRT